MSLGSYGISEDGTFFRPGAGCACAQCRQAAATETSSAYAEESDRGSLTGTVISSLEGSASSGDYEVDTLVYSLTNRWNYTQPVGSPTTVTYSFMTSVPSYESGVVDFQVFNDTMKAAAESALAKWAAVTNLTFTEVSDSGDGGQIRFGSNFQSSTAGYAYYPSTSDVGGDVWIANNYSYNTAPEEGNYGYLVYLHEIGHALGLKHPGAYSSSDEGPYLSSSVDNTNYSVMSYNDVTFYPSSLGSYDIEAIQYLYGLTSSGQIGNLIYGDDNAASYSMSGGSVFAEGGADTIVGSSSSEGMVGGYGSDQMTGAGGDDIIYGNHNTDLILGGDGADTIFGGQNDGDPRLDAYGFLRMQDGTETIYGGAGADVIYGNYGNEIIYGEGGGDLLYGGQNEDTVSGGSGSDTIWGNRDNDTLNGGDGIDYFRFSSNSGDDVIEDFNTALDWIVVAPDINGTGITTEAEVLARTSDDSSGNAVVDLGDGNTITLSGVSTSSLSTFSFWVTG